MTLYYCLIYFFIFSFIGWVLEVAFHAITLGKVINRGFLNGPVCPVYGCGVLVVMWAVELTEKLGYISLGEDAGSLKDAFILFLFGLVLATAVELLAGWLLDMLFHMRWWDYSDRPLNLHGYICLEFSIIWGFCISFVVRMVFPILESWKTTIFRASTAGYIVIGIMSVIFAADIGITVAIVIGLNRHLKELDDLRDSMRRISDRLSESIGERTIRTARSVEESRVQATLAKYELRDAMEEGKEEAISQINQRMSEYEEKKQEFQKRISDLTDKLTRHKTFGYGRTLMTIHKAYHRDYGDSLVELIKNIVK